MAASTHPYTLPDTPTEEGFLARYRRPVPQPLAAGYIAARTVPGDLVLDPFCQDATVIRAATTSGRRAVAVTGNPLLALLTRVEASPPSPGALQAALAKIHYATKLDTPLGEHLDGLYATTCSRCQASVPAAAFIWDHSTHVPVLRDYTCPHCQHAAREPVPPEEVADHLSFDAQGFHRRLVAERLRIDGGHRRLQERLLDLYTPRGVYALTSLVLKVELLYGPGSLRDALTAALLHTLDVASKLNRVTEDGWQPVHSLRPPRQFREANVWRTFSGAVQAIAAWPHPPALALLATLEAALRPDEGPDAHGACVLAESLPRLAGPLGGQVALALSQLPRFEPTFAALSYLWGGWLLGKEGTRAAERLLQQRTPQHARYLRAIRSALGAASSTLGPQGQLVMVFQAPATRFLESLLVAAGAVGAPLLDARHGLLDDRPAGRYDVRRAEHHLVFGPRAGPQPARTEPEAAASALAAKTAAAVLAGRGEPAPFGALHGPIWCALARAGLLAADPTRLTGEEWRRQLASAVERGLEGALGSPLAIVTLGGDAGQAAWWLQDPPGGVTPLADRVEALVREALAGGKPVSEPVLWQEIMRRLPAGLSPSWPLARACLLAYGTRLAHASWALAPEEQALQATARRQQLLGDLTALGRSLGYDVRADVAQGELWAGAQAPEDAPQPDLAWHEGPDLAYAFLLRESAVTADLRAMPPPEAGRRVLVIPERRVALHRHKLATAPPWHAELERAGWSFLREGALSDLLGQPPDRARFAAALGLGEPGAQLSLFS